MNETIETNEDIELNEISNCGEDRIWSVYLHTVPKEINGYDWDKYYVGITKSKPEHRWGKNGNGYKRQVFYRAIQKYGWNNIKHEVLFTGLSQKDANEKEMTLIKELNSNNRIYGYNNTFGGDSNRHFTKPLAQYDLDGNFLKIFSSIEEAEKIYGSISMNAQMSRGYIWKRVKDINNIPQKVNPYINPFYSEPLEQYDLFGNYIQTFINRYEAAKIYPYLSVERKGRNIVTLYGYQWKYQSSNIKIKDISNEKHIINKVYIYYLDGTFLGEFKNKKEAVRILHPKDEGRNVPNRIFDNIYNNEYLGYRWARKYYERLPELIRITRGNRPVIQIDPKTNKVIDIYPSSTIAETYFNISKSKKPHAINESCRTHKSNVYGYIWYYFEDYIFEESSIDDSFLLEKYEIYKSILNDLKK